MSEKESAGWRLFTWVVYFYAGCAVLAVVTAPIVYAIDHPAEAAGAVWVLLGALIVVAVLTAAYFKTGIAGRRRPSGAHGFLGILTGYVLLIFVTAFLYHAGFVYWFSLLVGIAVSVLIKVLFAHWRKSLSGSAPPEPEMRLIYRRQEMRRE